MLRYGKASEGDISRASGMRRVLIVIFVLSSGTGFAHIGTVVYPVFELPTADLPSLHDETLADWDAAIPNASVTYSSFTRLGLDGQIDPSSLAWRVFLAWHYESQSIYFAIERVDDFYIPASEDVFDRERVELSLDADHSGGRHAFFDSDMSLAQQQRLWDAEAQTYHLKPVPFAEQGSRVDMDGLATPWVTQEPWTEVGGFHDGREPNYSVIEARLTPWDDLNWQGPDVSIQSSLRPDAIIGFQILVYDNDLIGVPTGAVYSLHFGEAWEQGNADSFVDAQLIPCASADCSQGNVTSVGVSSWARVKASLTVD
jgi:hypothetical protein